MVTQYTNATFSTVKIKTSNNSVLVVGSGETVNATNGETLKKINYPLLSKGWRKLF